LEVKTAIFVLGSAENTLKYTIKFLKAASELIAGFFCRGFMFA
jgi:hypothetical protein